MKKTKRVIALLGAIILFLMYACTLLFALIGHESAKELLMASIAATIILPVLLYGYLLVYRLSQKKDSADTDPQNHT